MKLDKAKEIAARLFKVGKTKVKIEGDTAKVKEAITTQDVKALIADGVIKKRKLNEQSRVRARKLQDKRSKGRKKGSGKRKGTKKARTNKKEKWVKGVRALRKKLSSLKEKGEVKEGKYRRYYKLVKGGYFKGKKHLEETVKAEAKE